MAKQFRIKMSALRSEFLTAAKHGQGKLNLSVSRNYQRVEYIMDSGRAAFSGASIPEFVDHLESGFSAPTIDLDTSMIPVRKRKRSRYNDCEGDFRYDLYSAGDENCFVEWTKRESIPGIHVQFFLGFTAVTSADVISDYCRWVLSALTTLEASGVDCSVSVFNRGKHRTESDAGISEFHIDVKNEGERNDFSDWSAILAPGSYRILGFFCLVLAADSKGEVCSGGFGGSTGEKWGVDFNPETRVIEISAESSTRHFPEELMTLQLAEAIGKARGE